jgi:hypothetical protein
VDTGFRKRSCRNNMLERDDSSKTVPIGALERRAAAFCRGAITGDVRRVGAHGRFRTSRDHRVRPLEDMKA